MNNALDVLRERGFIAQTTFEDELNKTFENGMVTLTDYGGDKTVGFCLLNGSPMLEKEMSVLVMPGETAVFELIVPAVMADIIDIGIAGSDTAYIFKAGVLLVVLGICVTNTC